MSDNSEDKPINEEGKSDHAALSALLIGTHPDPASASRRNYHLTNFQMFWLTALFTIFIPLIVSGAFEIDPKFSNAFYKITISFTTSLIIFHALIYNNRNHHSIVFLRSLDYIYLSIAGLGLLATTEIARLDVSTRYQNSMDHVKEEVQDILNRAQEETKFACEIVKMDNQCAREQGYEISILKLINSNNFEKISDYKVIVEFLKKNSNDNDESYQSRSNAIKSSIIDRYISISPDPNELYIPNIPKEIGYFLLASALALRLSRVTAEIRTWHVRS